MIRLALFGCPIKSSLSPFIHQSFATNLGLQVSYILIECNQRAFARRLDEFRRSGGAGCNVTLPLKRDAWKLSASATPEVELAQAANTLVFKDSSAGFSAHNTDGLGLVSDLTVNHSIRLDDQRLLIVGAGGATAGVLGNLLAAGTREIVLVNRSRDRAEALAERFRGVGKISIANWQDLPGLGQFKLLINATSIGHQGKAPPLTGSLFAEGAACYDLNYHLASQPLKKLCGDLGQLYIDGLGMLVEQAVESFHIWTGRKPDGRTVIEACRKKLASKAGSSG